ncbi:MAG: hypothetical protein KBT46_02225, partial [Ruminococcus sp.]|nr:hypothetical protein [Candidatus Copronaster equi]
FNPYNELKPVVYYGSSITHGGCASRPGNNYPAIVSIKTLTDFICLGFSGNAHGEAEIANYIPDLDISAFVMEYDHNDVMNPENLKDKHFSFYKTVRSKHPDIPIIIFSAPYSSYLKNEMSITHKIVYESFLKAKENDENVFFIDGQKVFGEEYRTCCSVDGTHPNDFGFVKMADAVLDILKK